MLAWVMFAAVPLLIAPWFLDYAQEAKTAALLVVVTVLAARRAALGMASAGGGRSLADGALLLGAAAAAGLVACLWAPHGRVALHALRNEWLAVAAALLVTPAALPRAWQKALVAGAAAVAVLGLGQVALDLRVLTPAADPGQFPGVTFGNRGLASLFVALGLAPALEMWRSEARRRWLTGPVLAALALFVLVAMTRAVWLGCLLAAVVWAAAGRRRRLAYGAPPVPRQPPSRRAFLLKLALPLAALTLAAVGLGIVLHNDALRVLLTQRLDPASWTANPRLTLWRVALERFAGGGTRVLLLGFGPGAFQELAPAWLAGTALQERMFLDAHNDLLQVLLEYGVLGLALRLTLVAGGLRSLWHAAVSASDSSGPAAVSLANATLLLAASLFFYPLHLPYFLALFAIFLRSAPPLPGRLPARDVALSAPHRALAAALALLAALLFAQRLPIEAGMRAYVKEPQPYVRRAAERQRLAALLAHASAPALYFRLLEPVLNRPNPLGLAGRPAAAATGPR